MKRITRALASITAGVMLLSGCAQLELNQEVDDFPEFNAWSTYGTATSTYADVAAVANTISNEEDAQIRILTSDTGVGRLSPLRNKQATMARTGDEYIFAFDGEEDFTTADWGPQDVRMVWTPTAPHGMMSRAGSGIDSPADLKGKKVPWATANPSVQNKVEAYLAYGGLTWDDVERVDISYSEQPAALQAGQIDALFLQVYGSSLYELEAAIDTQWLELDPEDTEAVEAVAEVAPSVEIGPFENAAGQEEGQTDNGFIYAVPFVAYSELSDTQAYQTAKAFQEHYPVYKDATPTTLNWDLEHVFTTPIQVPFHDGTVQFLEENGAWTEEAEQRNQELIAYGEEMRETWPDFLEQADASGDLGQQWIEWKDEHLEPID